MRDFTGLGILVETESICCTGLYDLDPYFELWANFVRVDLGSDQYKLAKCNAFVWLLSSRCVVGLEKDTGLLFNVVQMYSCH